MSKLLSPTARFPMRCSFVLFVVALLFGSSIGSSSVAAASASDENNAVKDVDVTRAEDIPSNDETAPNGSSNNNNHSEECMIEKDNHNDNDADVNIHKEELEAAHDLENQVYYSSEGDHEEEESFSSSDDEDYYAVEEDEESDDEEEEHKPPIDDYYPPESNRQQHQQRSPRVQNAQQRREAVMKLWQSGSVTELYYLALQCEQVKQDESGLESPVPSQQDWEIYQDTYRSVMTQFQVAPSIPGPDFSPTAIRVPFEVQYTPDAGRGIFALEPIAQGTLIWDTTNTAAFVSPHMYRQFLRQLPRKLSCDLIDWAYTRRSASQRPMVCADLDQGSLMNSDNDEANIGFGPDQEQQQPSAGCDMTFYALRDIQAGEELRVAYGAFIQPDLWDEMGLGYDTVLIWEQNTKRT